MDFELSSRNFNSSVRAERSFAICYLNVVIKPLCGILDICLNHYFRSQNSVRVLSVADCDRKWKMLFGSRFLVALLRNLADFATGIHFRREKPEHGNAPITIYLCMCLLPLWSPTIFPQCFHNFLPMMTRAVLIFDYPVWFCYWSIRWVLRCI